ncbi:MAG: M28 family peptidase [Allosphingosinicella sp.]
MLIRLLALLLAFMPAAAFADPIDPEAIRRHIDVLASDAFEGREPGTAGEDKSIAYIAGRLQAYGLEPAGPANSWYQPLEIAVRRPGEETSLWQAREGAARIALDRDSLILLGRSQHETLADAPVVFAGHGAVIPSRGLDQLAGADLTGAVVLILYDEPGTPGFPGYAERVDAVAARGAAAVIGIVGSGLPWPVVQRVYDSGQHRLAIASGAPIQGAISQAAAERLLRAAHDDLAVLLDSPPASFRPVRLKLRATFDVATDIQTIATHNVIGRIRGTAGGGESLLYLAHWDHLGICEPDSDRDRICNGAVDNASGVASLIEIARALHRKPRPKRDILFLATTGEEMGLLGAEYFATRPPVPIRSIVAAINLDTVAIAPRGSKVAVMRSGVPALDSLIDRTIAETGRTLDSDSEGDALLERQDGWAMARAGVPAAVVGGWFSDMNRLNAFLAGPYHSAADNPGPKLELGGAAEDADLLVALGRKLSDPEVYQPPVR